MLHKLVFDTSDADSILDSANVGAYLRAGADGAFIDHRTVSATEWLQTYSAMADGLGNPLTSTGGALDVNILTPITVDTKVDGIYSGGNTDPDNVGLISHVRGAAPADADQTFRSTGAAASSDANVAANIKGIDTNSFGMVFNGTTWDRVRGTGALGSMNVNITNTTTTVSDAALANTAYAAGKTLITTGGTAQSAVAAPLANRKYLWTYNNSNKAMYLGEDADGYPLPPGSEIQMRAGAAVDVKFFGAVTGQDLRHLELS